MSRTLAVTVLAAYKARTARAGALGTSRKLNVERERGVLSVGFALRTRYVCDCLHCDKACARCVGADFTVIWAGKCNI